MNTTERIDRYRNSLARFDQWVNEHRQPDGSWCRPSSADGYFSSIHYANYIGRRDQALAMLRYVASRFLEADGTLKQGPERDGMVIYVPSWLAWGAFEADAFQLSTQLLDYVVSFQSPGCGGFFAGAPGRRDLRGPIGFDSTTIATIATARTGRTAASVKAADFLVKLVHAQPAPDEKLYTAWAEPEGLLTEEHQPAETSILRWSEPGQYYYKVGLFTVALAHVYGATGKREYLDVAVELYRRTVTRAADLWTNTLGHKMCWAATYLHAITGQPEYLQHACRLADHLVAMQYHDGSFTYPELFPTFPPEQWDILPNLGSQFALWIARTLRALEA